MLFSIAPVLQIFPEQLYWNSMLAEQTETTVRLFRRIIGSTLMFRCDILYALGTILELLGTMCETLFPRSGQRLHLERFSSRRCHLPEHHLASLGGRFPRLYILVEKAFG